MFRLPATIAAAMLLAACSTSKKCDIKQDEAKEERVFQECLKALPVGAQLGAAVRQCAEAAANMSYSVECEGHE